MPRVPVWSLGGDDSWLHGRGEGLVARLGPGVGSIVLMRLLLVQMDPLFLVAVVQFGAPSHFLE